MPFALRFEESAGMPLAMVFDTIEEAVRQGAWTEANDGTKRVRDVIEVESGEDPLYEDAEQQSPRPGSGKVAGRSEVNEAKRIIDTERARTADPSDGFNMILDSDSWLNTGTAAEDRR